MNYSAKVYVSPKPTVNDPEGLTILGGLKALGYADVAAVRAGKFFQITLAADSESDAREKVDGMCEQLLANPVIESYDFTLSESGL